jgi:hypothetical protein
MRASKGRYGGGRVDEQGKTPIVQRAQDLANSGDFEGFNALVQTLWERKHTPSDLS